MNGNDAIRGRVGKGLLWITRMTTDHEDEEVACLGFGGGSGARRVFEQSWRVFKGAAQGSAVLERGDLLVALLDEAGDDVGLDPLRVPARQADWYLNTFLRVPKGRRAALTRGDR